MAGLVAVWVVVGLAHCLLFAFATAAVARGKGLNYGGWWVVGFLFGLVGLLIAAVMPSRMPTGSTVGGVYSAQGTARCPFCAEPIQPQAVVCRWCGRDLPEGPAVAPSAASPSAPPSAAGVVLLALLAVVGIAIIALNYVGLFPGGTDNNYLYAGFGAFAIGILGIAGLRVSRRSRRG